MDNGILNALFKDIDNEMDRRRFLRWAGLASGSVVLGRRPALAAERVPFRMDQVNTPQYVPTHFIPNFLPRHIAWDFKIFSSTGHGRLSAFTRDAVDSFASPWSYLITIAEQDLPGTCVAGVAGGGFRVVAAKRSPFRRLADLKGKKVGVVKFSGTDIALIYALKQLGIDPFNEVNRVNLGNPAGVVAALSTGELDAIAIWEPFASIAILEQGGTMVSDLREAFGVSQGGMYVRDGFIQKHPDATQEIVSALIKATNYLMNNKQAWATKTREITGQKPDIIETMLTNITPDITIPLKALRLIARGMYELGIAKKDVSETIEKKVTYSFLEKATGKPKEELGYA